MAGREVKGDHDPLDTVELALITEEFKDIIRKETGVCAEHGGDPNSLHFCHRADLDYVSCSPFRMTGPVRAAVRCPSPR